MVQDRKSKNLNPAYFTWETRHRARTWDDEKMKTEMTFEDVIRLGEEGLMKLPYRDLVALQLKFGDEAGLVELQKLGLKAVFESIKKPENLKEI